MRYCTILGVYPAFLSSCHNAALQAKQSPLLAERIPQYDDDAWLNLYLLAKSFPICIIPLSSVLPLDVPLTLPTPVVGTSGRSGDSGPYFNSKSV